jgi:acyl carrier protein
LITPIASVTDSAPNAIETELLTIWTSVLGIKRIARGDSFFELGGDSLLAIRLLGQIRDRWSIDLSMAELFDSPTVAGAAAQIESVLWARTSGGSGTGEGGEDREEVGF